MDKLPTINNYFFSLGVRNFGDGVFGFEAELQAEPEHGVLQGQARVVGQTDENGDPIWEELSFESDPEGVRKYTIPEQCIDDRGWCTMRWRFDTTAPATVAPSRWAERVENFTPVGYLNHE